MTTTISNPTTTTTPAAQNAAQAPAKRPRGRPKGAPKRPLARPFERGAVPTMLDAREAAEALRCSVESLRARCRRNATTDAEGNVIAPLAPGVVALKFGTTWRVRFDSPGGRP